MRTSLMEKPYKIRKSWETQRSAKHRKYASSVPFLNREATWNPYESGYSTECQTPPSTSFAPLLSEEAIWNRHVVKLNGVANNASAPVARTSLIEKPYGIRTSLETQLRAKLHKCTTCMHFLNGEAMRNSYEPGYPTEWRTPHCTSCVLCLVKKPFRINTSRETQRSAKHRRCTCCANFLNGDAVWNPYESGNSTECQTLQMHVSCALS